MPSKTCPKCGGSMAQGFVLDQTRGGVVLPRWVEGEPQMSVWTGLKIDGKPRIEVETWRCGRCGFLEHYAAGNQSRFERSRRQIQRIVLVVAALAAVLLGLAAVLLNR